MDKHLRILILENIPEDAMRIRRALEKTGLSFAAREVKTKAEYINYLDKGVDVIIADYDLPDLSAIRAFHILKERQLDIPFVFVADPISEDRADGCFELGAADFILKNRLPYLGPAVIHALEKKESAYQMGPAVIGAFERRTAEGSTSESTPAKVDLTDTHLRLQRIFEETIQALASVTESRDPFTAGHQKRVASLSYGIAYSIFSNNHDSAEVLYLAGLVHDIGKVAVPIEILSKPTDITELEMQLIKTHPRVGCEILKKIDFPWPIAQMVMQHHERLDGSGYPKGLKGQDIMMEARILGVADVVEAICYPRSYRSALTIEQAMEEMKRNEGTLYDPAVTNICISIFKSTDYSFIRSLEKCDELRAANIRRQP